METMRALLVTKPGTLETRDVPMPVPGDYDILCRMLYGATCAGTDLHVIHGRFVAPVECPTIIGHESIGRAVAVGPKVRHFRVGDLVTRVGAPPAPDGSYHLNWGGMAEYGIAKDHFAMREDGLPDAEWGAYRVNQVVPEGLIAPDDATMLITWRETLSYMQRIGAGEGSRVLVSGSGANGFALARHALILGAAWVGLLGSNARRGTGEALELSAYFDYRDAAALQALLRQQTGKVDIVIDATGKSGSLDALLPCLKPGGTVGVYGLDDALCYQMKPLNANGGFSFYNGGYDEAETHEAVLGFLRAGKLDAAAWLDKEHLFPLQSAAQAYAHVEEKRAIKALVQLSTADEM